MRTVILVFAMLAGSPAVAATVNSVDMTKVIRELGTAPCNPNGILEVEKEESVSTEVLQAQSDCDLLQFLKDAGYTVSDEELATAEWKFDEHAGIGARGPMSFWFDNRQYQTMYRTALNDPRQNAGWRTYVRDVYGQIVEIVIYEACANWQVQVPYVPSMDTHELDDEALIAVGVAAVNEGGSRDDVGRDGIDVGGGGSGSTIDDRDDIDVLILLEQIFKDVDFGDEVSNNYGDAFIEIDCGFIAEEGSTVTTGDICSDTFIKIIKKGGKDDGDNGHIPPIPLPAGALLLLTALGVFGYIRRYRQRS